MISDWLFTVSGPISHSCGTPEPSRATLCRTHAIDCRLPPQSVAPPLHIFFCTRSSFGSCCALWPNTRLLRTVLDRTDFGSTMRNSEYEIDDMERLQGGPPAETSAHNGASGWLKSLTMTAFDPADQASTRPPTKRPPGGLRYISVAAERMIL